jgi:hypothetical protein
MNIAVTASVGLILAVVCLAFALRAGRRKRLVDTIPTCKTSGVFIGLVELKGTAECEAPLVSHLAASRCVFYSWSVEEHWSRTVTETYRDSQGRTRTRTRRESGWKTVDSGGEQVPFYLRDDCGSVLVLPEGAKIEPVAIMSEQCGPSHPLYYGKGPAAAVMHSDHRRRFIEKAVPLHAPVYVMGRARERDDVVAPVIAHDNAAEMFLISTRSEQQVSNRLGWMFRGLSALGMVCAAGGFIAGDVPQPVGAVVAGAAYIGAWTVAWSVMVYNSVVALRQRVNQAWANVDVQLKRRHDLIPRLVAVVQGMRDHEQETQTVLAALRQQATATAPGESGPDPTAVTPVLMALREQYPTVTADENFRRLQEALVDIEHRIALARSYYNDVATFFNTRLQVVPDRFIAAPARMTSFALMNAGDFERAPVAVQFAE